MTKKDIERLIDQQQKIYDRNFEKYQETGERRYERAYQKAEDLIEIATIAAEASSRMEESQSFKADALVLCMMAINLANDWDENNARILIRNIATFGRIHGVFDPKKGAAK